jgi:Fe-Mn family superoxide dismutase
MKEVSRREALTKLATGGAGLALLNLGGAESVAAAEEVQTPGSATAQPIRAFRRQHQAKPLPFDPAKLKGLSERLIRSHWENNYGGSVKALNAVEQRLDAMMREKDLPAYV